MMRPYRARCRIRGVFNRNQAGFSNRGRGGGSKPSLPPQQHEQECRPRIPTFYPAHEEHHEQHDSDDRFRNLAPERSQHNREELYDKHREDDYRHQRKKSTSRSPSYDRYQRSRSRSRRTSPGSSYGYRSRSKSRSRVRSRTPSPRRRRESYSPDPPRSRSRRSRSRSRPRQRVRTPSRSASRSPSRYRKERRLESDELQMRRPPELLKQQEIKVTVSNIKVSERSSVKMKSPMEEFNKERFVQRKEFSFSSPRRRAEREPSPSMRWPLGNFKDDPVDMFKALEKRESSVDRFESKDVFRHNQPPKDSFRHSDAREKVNESLSDLSKRHHFSRSPSPTPLRRNVRSPVWNNSPAPSHESDQRRKSILKRKTLMDDEDSGSLYSNFPGSLSDSSALVIPGLGDMDTIEDEEKFLYGEEGEAGSTLGRQNQPSRNMETYGSGGRDFSRTDYPKASGERSTFSILGSDSPKRSTISRRLTSHRELPAVLDSPPKAQGSCSPFQNRRIDARFNESFSPRAEEVTSASSRYGIEKRRRYDSNEEESKRRDQLADTETNRKVQEVLKALGFDAEIVRRLKEEKPKSPVRDVDKEAEFYGIKPELPMSTFFDNSDATSVTEQITTTPADFNTWNSDTATYTTPSTPSLHESYSHPTASPSYMQNMLTQNVTYPSYLGTSATNMQQQQFITPVPIDTNNRSNLKVIPLNPQVPNAVDFYQSRNLKVVSTEMTQQTISAAMGNSRSGASSSQLMSGNRKYVNNSNNRNVANSSSRPSTGSLIRSAEDVQALMCRRENQVKQLGMLENEMVRMSKLQGELMRKKQKQKDGHKDPLLLENTKLQDEIMRQISQTRSSIEDTTELLKHSDFFLKPKVEKVAEEKLPLLPHPQKAEVPVIKDEDLEPEYNYVDPGDHWCKQCDDFMPSLQRLFDHLQCPEHYEKIPAYDFKCMREMYKPPPTPTYGSKKKFLTAAIKGSQFLVPCKGFFCKLCSEFLGNTKVAEGHLKSKDHNYKFLTYVLENPLYERKWNLDKTSSLSTKAHRLRMKKIEQERDREVERKKLSKLAEEKNRELIRSEAERSKSVGELDESILSSPKPESSRGKEISVNLKNLKKEGHNSRSKDEVGFGKFNWKKESEKSSDRKSEDTEKADAKEEQPASSSGNSTKTNISKIKINLIGKKLQPTSWQKNPHKVPDQKVPDAKKAKPMVGAFPLRKGKSNSSGIDIFGSSHRKNQKQGSSHPGNDANSSSKCSVSKKEIASAFDGKFKSRDERSKEATATTTAELELLEIPILTTSLIGQKAIVDSRPVHAPKSNLDLNRAFKCIPDVGESKQFKTTAPPLSTLNNPPLLYGPKLPEHLASKNNTQIELENNAKLEQNNTRSSSEQKNKRHAADLKSGVCGTSINETMAVTDLKDNDVVRHFEVVVVEAIKVSHSEEIKDKAIASVMQCTDMFEDTQTLKVVDLENNSSEQLAGVVTNIATDSIEIPFFDDGKLYVEEPSVDASIEKKKNPGSKVKNVFDMMDQDRVNDEITACLTECFCDSKTHFAACLGVNPSGVIRDSLPELVPNEHSKVDEDSDASNSGHDLFGDPPVLSPKHQSSSDLFHDNALEALKALHEVSEQATASLNKEIRDKHILGESLVADLPANLEENDGYPAHSDMESSNSAVSISLDIGSDMIVLDEMLFEMD